MEPDQAELSRRERISRLRDRRGQTEVAAWNEPGIEARSSSIISTQDATAPPDLPPLTVALPTFPPPSGVRPAIDVSMLSIPPLVSVAISEVPEADQVLGGRVGVRKLRRKPHPARHSRWAVTAAAAAGFAAMVPMMGSLRAAEPPPGDADADDSATKRVPEGSVTTTIELTTTTSLPLDGSTTSTTIDPAAATTVVPAGAVPAADGSATPVVPASTVPVVGALPPANTKPASGTAQSPVAPSPAAPAPVAPAAPSPTAAPAPVVTTPPAPAPTVAPVVTTAAPVATPAPTPAPTAPPQTTPPTTAAPQTTAPTTQPPPPVTSGSR